VQPDNKVIVGGTFDLSNGVRRGRLARFNTDGTLDTGFTPPDYTQGTVYDIALQPMERFSSSVQWGSYTA
jgi:hypothetical protein